MARFFRKRRYAKRKSYRRRRGRRVRKGRGRFFNRRVLRVLNRSAETKTVQFDLVNQQVYPATSTNFPDGFTIISPSNEIKGGNNLLLIEQGTGQGNRVGNKISTVSATLRGVIRPNILWEAVGNYNPCPMYVVIWVVSLAKHLTDSMSSLDTVCENSFFQDGNVSSGFQGTLVDLTRTVNRQHVRVHTKRVYKLGFSEYQSSFGINGQNNGAQRFMNNDFPLSKIFSIKLRFQRNVTFNDGTTNPTNMRRQYFFMIPYRVDGDVWKTNSGQLNGPVPLHVDFAVDYKFKDI